MAPPATPDDPHALYRGVPPRVAKVRAISSSDRLLRPTQASLAASRTKVLTGKDKARADAREQAQKRRRLARVAKENGRLTVPQSPKFRSLKTATPRSRADLLTRTSRELLEIAAIRKRVQAQKRKTQRYHDATTHSAAPGKSDQFSRALSASGGVGVPAVRRPKLTTPVGFAFEIDKRAARAEARRSLKRKSGDVRSSSSSSSRVKERKGEQVDEHKREQVDERKKEQVDEKVNVIGVVEEEEEEEESEDVDKERRKRRRLSTVAA
ncbi:unnamed protein product [Hyaloperonospora brassicae]|uniref:Ribosome biogenesis protein NOP53 n=1 Tax=Hyaloperonospora brassicae TaxID=162125 RepID=A0AAV0UXD6_HYABA|nr:unnamed protein product [Hyaloperonospora brassicae]